MTDRLEWFSNFQPLPEGIHTVQIADDTKLWVCGKGDIEIWCFIEGHSYKGLMHSILYVPKLKCNLFSVGLVFERNLSFVTFPNRCEFLTLSGKKVLEGIRYRKLYQLFITVIPPKQMMPSQQIDPSLITSSSTKEACIYSQLYRIHPESIMLL